MAKRKQLYRCSECGAEFGKWHGRCPSCNEWNTVDEEVARSSKDSEQPLQAVTLDSIKEQHTARIASGLGEFDQVCGGGMVPGSVILVGGEPGIGKSTLALQLASNLNILYISGEESPVQIKERAQRVGIKLNNVRVSTADRVEDIYSLMKKETPQCCVIDSIQTVYSDEAPGITGSVSQVRESATRLAGAARELAIPVIIIGHITKEGSIAGPKLLEHLVDTVMYFEGDSGLEHRILRSFKNRYGSVNEIGIFRMGATGLEEIKDRHRVFLSPFTTQAPGNAVSAAREGSRTILFEVQSLVSYTSFSNPRRMSDGFDLNRLILLCAVLEKHAGLKLGTHDVFLNVSGGFRLRETSGDLAVAMAVASSLKEEAIPARTGFMGEISLSGEMRSVSHCERRMREFMHAGYERIILPKPDLDEAAKSGFSGECIGITRLHEAMEHLFG